MKGLVAAQHAGARRSCSQEREPCSGSQGQKIAEAHKAALLIQRQRERLVAADAKRGRHVDFSETPAALDRSAYLEVTSWASSFNSRLRDTEEQIAVVLQQVLGASRPGDGLGTHSPSKHHQGEALAAPAAVLEPRPPSTPRPGAGGRPAIANIDWQGGTFPVMTPVTGTARTLAAASLPACAGEDLKQMHPFSCSVLDRLRALEAAVCKSHTQVDSSPAAVIAIKEQVEQLALRLAELGTTASTTDTPRQLDRSLHYSEPMFNQGGRNFCESFHGETTLASQSHSPAAMKHRSATAIASELPSVPSLDERIGGMEYNVSLMSLSHLKLATRLDAVEERCEVAHTSDGAASQSRLTLLESGLKEVSGQAEAQQEEFDTLPGQLDSLRTRMEEMERKLGFTSMPHRGQLRQVTGDGAARSRLTALESSVKEMQEEEFESVPGQLDSLRLRLEETERKLGCVFSLSASELRGVVEGAGKDKGFDKGLDKGLDKGRLTVVESNLKEVAEQQEELDILPGQLDAVLLRVEELEQRLGSTCSPAAQQLRQASHAATESKSRLSMAEAGLADISSQIREMLASTASEPVALRPRLSAMEKQLAAVADEVRQVGASALGLLEDHAMLEAQAKDRLAALESQASPEAGISAIPIVAAPLTSDSESRLQDLRAQCFEKCIELQRRLGVVEGICEEFKDKMKELSSAASRHAARTAERLDELERTTSAGSRSAWTRMASRPRLQSNTEEIATVAAAEQKKAQAQEELAAAKPAEMRAADQDTPESHESSQHQVEDLAVADRSGRSEESASAQVREAGDDSLQSQDLEAKAHPPQVVADWKDYRADADAAERHGKGEVKFKQVKAIARELLHRKNPAQKQPKVQPASSRRKPGEKAKIPVGDRDKWKYEELNGHIISVTTTNKVEPIVVKSKDEAIRTLHKHPEKYFGCHWNKPEYQSKVKLYPRACMFFPPGSRVSDAFDCMVANYAALPANVQCRSDSYSERCLSMHGGRRLAWKSPGRQQGVEDTPMLKLIGDVDPGDVHQGQIGDCWLLSAISALAEFDGAIHTLLRKSGPFDLLPRDEFNVYVVELYDLKTWKAVDIEVDERLATVSDKSTDLLGTKPSQDGEVWPCILEKAVAAHCGGWEKIVGGTCTHAFRILTGCRQVYTIMRPKGGKGGYCCFGAYNPNKNCWEELDNSPHGGFQGLWPMDWPKLGGGGDMDKALDEEELFVRMCQWDDANYVMCAGSGPGHDTNLTDGVVDGHAYTILECINNAGGTDFDMIKMRNPWGLQEPTRNAWSDGGGNWTKHPKVYKGCGCPVATDDGVFWLEKDDFFEYFTTIHLCAKDMSSFMQTTSAEIEQA